MTIKGKEYKTELAWLIRSSDRDELYITGSGALCLLKRGHDHYTQVYTAGGKNHEVKA
jgi:hypothetical protein